MAVTVGGWSPGKERVSLSRGWDLSLALRFLCCWTFWPRRVAQLIPVSTVVTELRRPPFFLQAHKGDAPCLEAEALQGLLDALGAAPIPRNVNQAARASPPASYICLH